MPNSPPLPLEVADFALSPSLSCCRILLFFGLHSQVLSLVFSLLMPGSCCRKFPAPFCFLAGDVCENLSLPSTLLLNQKGSLPVFLPLISLVCSIEDEIVPQRMHKVIVVSLAKLVASSALLFVVLLFSCFCACDHAIRLYGL